MSDANPNPSTKPAWLSGGDDEPPARLVAIRITPEATADGLDDVFSLAAKYDLVVFDARSGRVHFPLKELGDEADAMFWPSGAVQAAVAGGFGLVIAIIAWIVGIPILSGIVIVVGGFMFVMAVFTFVHAGRKACGSGAHQGAPHRRTREDTGSTKTRRVGPQTHPTTTREAYVISAGSRPALHVSRLNNPALDTAHRSACVASRHGQMTMPVIRARPPPPSRRGSARA